MNNLIDARGVQLANVPHKPADSNIVRFPSPKPRLRADVPPFDPTNAAHLRAWESIFDFGRTNHGEA